MSCRKRRIRCGAEKPTCASCARLNKECVYDSGQTTSSIQRLKAELEAELQQEREAKERLLLLLQQPTACNTGPPTSTTRNDGPSSSSQLISRNPRPLQAPDPSFSFDFDLLDSAMMDFSSSLQSAGVAPMFLQEEQNMLMISDLVDPDNVPPAVRDQLLDLFFSRTGAFRVVFHVPRFYTRLTLPPASRPHPPLLYTMYLLACRRSTNPALRRLEASFFAIAERQIQTGITKCDRLLDVIRATALMTNYLVSVHRYNEGYHMAGAAIRTVTVCGLHRIGSSTWKPVVPIGNSIALFVLRIGGYALPPAEDAIELAERIHAFWAVYEIDQLTSIAYLWDLGLDVDNITTPLPRPFDHYVLGLLNESDDIDISITTALDPSYQPPPGASPDSFHIMRLKALTMVSRSVSLRALRPESPPETSLSIYQNTFSPTTASTTSPETARGRFAVSSQLSLISNPAAFVSHKKVLDLICERLPEGYKCPWGRWDEGSDVSMPRLNLKRDAMVLHFLFASAYLQTWNNKSLMLRMTKPCWLLDELSILSAHTAIT
ncbi:hypothetical protein, variant [Cryptococcus amylolentus CBS 6039]|nr:hypothetical protein, variant [Cryptococcus amylolentus CBS 6039]ODN80430.1 hypothetical protein, variant [Cryptococcus amylolentus CBS 6039]